MDMTGLWWFEYQPKRWLKRKTYYKARSLYRLVMRRKFRFIYTGKVGWIYGIRLIDFPSS